MESGPSIRPLRQAEANYSGTGTQRHKITISLLHLHYPLHGAIFVNEQHQGVFTARDNFTNVIPLFPPSQGGSCEKYICFKIDTISPFFTAAKGEGKNIDFPPRGGFA